MPGFHRSGGGDRGGFKKKFGGGGRGGDRPMMHKATCGDCGRPCEVPFRPSPDRPVFCNSCFKKEGDRDFGHNDRRNRDDRDNRDFSKPAGKSASINSDQFATLNNKLDQILTILNTAVATDEEDEEEYEDEEEKE